MKKSAFAIFVVLALLAPVSMRSAEPATQTPEQAAALLASGQWFFQGKNWSNVRTFKTDGTFHGRKDGNWKIADGKVRLIFVDHEDTLILPLDPKGTQGVDSAGLPLSAVQQPLAGAPAPSVPVAQQTEAEINALFTSGTWHFQGKGWANDRVFNQDKTFTGGGDGSWRMGDGVVIVTTGGKEMKLNLPIDPKGTSGIGSTGFPVFIYRQGETPVPTPPAGPAIAANPAASAAPAAPAEPAAPAPLAAVAPTGPVPPVLMTALTRGQWYFQGTNWSKTRVFKQDRTFVTQRENGGEDGTWGVDGSTLVLVFKNAIVHKLNLPLDPGGTKGVEESGKWIVAIEQPYDPVAANPPTLPAEITPEMISAATASKQTPDEITALLTRRQWHFQGINWANSRVFKADGTYKGGGDGKWSVERGWVVVSSKDNFLLPLDPKGTYGLDSKGNPIVVTQEFRWPAPEELAQQESKNHSAQSDSAITAMLVQGQWFTQGRSWINTRVFRPDGTFYTQHRPGEGGTWKILEGMVVLNFKSSKNLFLFPIDPSGTLGRDAQGIPMMSIQQPLADEPTPPPTAPPGVAKATPSVPKTTPSTGATPASASSTPRPYNPSSHPYGEKEEHTVVIPDTPKPSVSPTTPPVLR